MSKRKIYYLCTFMYRMPLTFNSRFKMAPHESPTTSQPSSGEGEGESTPEEGAEHPEAETIEPPMSLTDLLG